MFRRMGLFIRSFMTHKEYTSAKTMSTLTVDPPDLTEGT